MIIIVIINTAVLSRRTHPRHMIQSERLRVSLCAGVYTKCPYTISYRECYVTGKKNLQKKGEMFRTPFFIEQANCGHFFFN